MADGAEDEESSRPRPAEFSLGALRAENSKLEFFTELLQRFLVEEERRCVLINGVATVVILNYVYKRTAAQPCKSLGSLLKLDITP